MKNPGTRLYVGCGLTNAPEKFRENVELFKNKLGDEGFEVLGFLGLTAGEPEDVYAWDIEHCVQGCDLFVAVCDHPALGLGWELSMAVEKYNKPTLGVAHEDAVITRLVLGAAALKPNFTFMRYENLIQDVPFMIRRHLMDQALV
jgi:hypothetical protein